MIQTLEGLDEKRIRLEKELESLQAKIHDTGDDFNDLIYLIEDLVTSKDMLATRQRLQGRLRVLLDSIVILISKHKSAAGHHGYCMDKRAIVELRFRTGKYRQFSVLYSAQAMDIEWSRENQGTITKLPAKFDRTDPAATIPAPKSA